MGKVTEIDSNKPHTVAEVICVKCTGRWIATYPVETLLKDLDCSNCGQGFVILTGEDTRDWKDFV